MTRVARSWLANYRRDWIAADLAAGATSAAVVLPKALAYATIAGLPVQVGLYTAFVAPLVYALLGTSATLSVTTTTTIAILAGSALGEVATGSSGVTLATATATLSVLVGLMLLAARLLRLGFLASFISDPVLTGFKAGIGCVIVLDQLPKLFGVHIEKAGFVRDIHALLAQLPATSLPTLAVAAGTLIGLLLLARFLPRAPAPVIAVGAAIAATWLLDLGALGVGTVGAIPAGLPPFVLPDRSLLQLLWPAAAGIALMSFTESSAAARAFRRADEARVSPNQELVATGFGNVLGGFFGAMPSGGGTSQTAVNSNAGARSQMAGIVCAAIALATMLFLAPVIAMIPHAALAAIVIKYSIGLVSFAEMRSILQVRAVEFRWALVAFLGVMVLGTLKGILVAVLVSMLSLMYQSNNPMVFEVRRKPGTNIFRPRSDKHPDDEMPDGLLVVRVLGRIYFANASYVGAIVRDLVDARKPRELILDCSAIPDFEYTALLGLVEFEADMRKKGVRLVLAALNPEARRAVNRTAIGAVLAESEGLLPTVEIAVGRYARALAAQG